MTPPNGATATSDAESRRQELIAMNEAAVDEHFANENPENVDKAVALYTDDITWEVPARKRLLRDKDEVEAEYRGIFGAMENVEREELDRFATEDRVVTDEILRFDLVREGFVNCPVPIPSRVEMRLVHIFHLRDGRISRENAYEMWHKLD